MYGWWGYDQRVHAQIAAIRLGQSYGSLIPIILGIIVLFPVILFGLFIVPFVTCLPLWQRVFLHPNVVEIHSRRARVTIVIGLIALLIFILSGLLGLHRWEPNEVTIYLVYLGTFLVTIGTLTALNAWLQARLSRANPHKVHGNGFGIINLHCLLTKRRPNHIFTFIQDGAIVAYFLRIVFIAPKDERLAYLFLVSPFLCILIAYTWHCQIKFSKGENVTFLS